MKSSILYKVYMGRLLPLSGVFSVMLYLIMFDEIALYGNFETVVLFVMIAMTGAVAYFLIRKPSEHVFVNSLPITKAKQWNAMYLAILTLIGIVYTVYVLAVYMQCRSEVNNFKEILISGIVKCCTAVFLTTLVLWILSHIDFHFPVLLVVCVVVFLIGMVALGRGVQKAFNTDANNFVYQCKNYWILMTVPIKAINNMLEEGWDVSFAGYEFNEKITVTVIYLAVIIVLTVLMAIFARKNYSVISLEKPLNRGYAKRFSKPFIVACVALSAMSGLCLIGEIVDRIRLDIVTTEEYSEYEDEELYSAIDASYYDYYDSMAVVARKDGEVYYKGMMFKSLSDMYEFKFFKYEMYKFDFPKEYLLRFVGFAVASVGLGIGVVIVTEKKHKNKEATV